MIFMENRQAFDRGSLRGIFKWSDRSVIVFLQFYINLLWSFLIMEHGDKNTS